MSKEGQNKIGIEGIGVASQSTLVSEMTLVGTETLYRLACIR
jgi:uridine phosphorylase